jgi:hypothetical protein
VVQIFNILGDFSNFANIISWEFYFANFC